MINEVFSDFQLLGTRIAKIEATNTFINLPPSDELDISIDMGNCKDEIINHDDSLEGILQQYINFSAALKTDKQLFIKISLMAEGCFTSSIKDEELFKQMLILNGNTALYSILRAHITTITALSLGEGKIVLPMINFVKLIEQQKDTSKQPKVK